MFAQYQEIRAVDNMRYVTNEILMDDPGQKNAGGKARNDVLAICCKNGYKPLNLQWQPLGNRTIIHLIKLQYAAKREYKSKFQQLKRGDTLIVQFPNVRYLFSIGKLLKAISHHGVDVVIWIHDIPSLRSEADPSVSKILIRRLRQMEDQSFKAASVIVSHNSRMTAYLLSRGVDRDKLIELRLFDYLLAKDPVVKRDGRSSVIVAGNLGKDKAGYLIQIPDALNMNLYGEGFQSLGRDNIVYYGSFLPEELTDHLVGDFGLVWDGDNIDGCTGAFGNYMKYNNPHKASLYLAAGLPVIIWDQAALADFVLEHHCGLVVTSLRELPETIDRLSDSEYSFMKKNAEAIGCRLRKGYYSERVLQKIASRK